MILLFFGDTGAPPVVIRRQPALPDPYPDDVISDDARRFWEDRHREQHERVKRVKARIDKAKDKVPSDVPAANPLRTAEAAVQSADTKLEAAPPRFVDWSGLETNLDRAEKALKSVEAAVRREMEEQEDEDIMLLAAALSMGGYRG